MTLRVRRCHSQSLIRKREQQGDRRCWGRCLQLLPAYAGLGQDSVLGLRLLRSSA